MPGGFSGGRTYFCAAQSLQLEEGNPMAAKTSVKSAPEVGRAARPSLRGAEQRYHRRPASVDLAQARQRSHPSSGHPDPGRRRAARRGIVLPVEPEPARRQPSPGSLAARRHDRPPPPGQEQFLQPHRHRRRSRQSGQELDRLKVFESQDSIAASSRNSVFVA